MTDEVSESRCLTKLSGGSSFIFPPSVFPRVPLAVPFWNGATFKAVLRTVLSGQIVSGAALDALKTALIGQLGSSDVILCGSGTAALELALRACGVRQGDEVVVPTFCCAAVVAPVNSLGATPVLADAGRDLNMTVDTVAATLTRKTKAVVVPHLFGNPAEVDRIVEFVEQKDIAIIDDAAQALGATIDHRPVGSFGDAGVVSFGAEKLCFGIGGGAVVSSARDMLNRVDDSALVPATCCPVIQKFLSTLILRRWRAWTFPLAAVLAPRRSPEALEPYAKKSMANLDAALAVTLLASLDEAIAARRERVRAYRELLGDEPELELIPHRPGTAALAQVVRVIKKRRGVDLPAALIRALRSAGYEIQGSYVPIHRLPGCAVCVWDHLPYAEKTWEDLIELPCEPSVTLDRIDQITTIIKRVIADA